MDESRLPPRGSGPLMTEERYLELMSVKSDILRLLKNPEMTMDLFWKLADKGFSSCLLPFRHSFVTIGEALDYIVKDADTWGDFTDIAEDIVSDWWHEKKHGEDIRAWGQSRGIPAEPMFVVYSFFDRKQLYMIYCQHCGLKGAREILKTIDLAIDYFTFVLKRHGDLSDGDREILAAVC